MEGKTMLVFREGDFNDLPQLKALGMMAYEQFASVLGEVHWNKLKEFLQDEKSWIDLLNKAKVFVCEDKVIVGMAYLMPSGNPTTIFDKDWAQVRMIGVHPDYRGKGIAKKLTKECIGHAMQAGEKTLALHTSEFMDAARHIYEGLGFQQVRELEPRYGKRYWLYHLNL
jgi:ribosomal protein S18 acetylase RimI-like enzyme